MRDFRKYDIWLQSVDFATEIYKLTATFPKNELYALADQMQRAVVSIGSNIAEGCSRESEKDFAHFLSIAIGSAFEVETQLRIALNVKYISEDKYNSLVETLSVTERQIHALIKMVSPSQR